MGRTGFVALIASVYTVCVAPSLERSGHPQAAKTIQASEARSGPFDLRESPNGPVTAAAYTLRTRLTIALRRSELRGVSFSEDELPPRVLAPVTYVVLRWGEQDWARVPREVGRRPLSVVMVPDGWPPTSDKAIWPSWTSESMAVIEEFGGVRPFDDAAVVAAFPSVAIRPGHRIVAWVGQLGSPKPGWLASTRSALITEDDLASWR